MYPIACGQFNCVGKLQKRYHVTKTTKTAKSISVDKERYLLCNLQICVFVQNEV